jgi:hypothetical protein
MKHRVVRCGYHYSFGWLRRPESDGDEGYCYEAPDGDLIYSGVNDHREEMYLYEIIDRQTGDHYLIDNVGLEQG